MSNRLIFDENGRVRVTKDEFDRLRMFAARNGFAIGPIQTAGDLLEASILGLPDTVVEDMCSFLDGIDSTSSCSDSDTDETSSD